MAQMYPAAALSYVEKTRQEAHTLSKTITKFTGSENIMATKREIEEVCDDHGWRGVGWYYLTRYSLDRPIWNTTIDLMKEKDIQFDRGSEEGYAKYTSSIRETLCQVYCHAVLRKKLKAKWNELHRRTNETCRQFLLRVQQLRRELSGADISITDEDELFAWSRGLGSDDRYGGWIAGGAIIWLQSVYPSSSGTDCTAS
ncbi:hypothetical protein Pmar_PMAR013078 [Perkinsus marinus ATCC 50983]|uniref:Uncharacterized protein n=1 Tax=Perkinsus marinus (strain ATCC 50983 / TXsc) TaxID=423536 RepID=C5KUS6_PERM5|nr:hypothetical protein Pmar_PMAR013078 [Perkinsus marinus ATCC 50983]EER11797.1 hypothetical protein Pmar_PMAR013078 [Perkinsus marinus ATCC 50983]|eukprot:XP_002780002.1 hypothetical protein Pmar_PMAR013078 [Perkinsus marinus ATCC 50983]